VTTPTKHAERLAEWEIATIAALAQEDLDAHTADTIVWDPEAWLAKAIARRQERALDNAGVRTQLRTQAQRLDILHYQHPKPVADLEPLPTPDDTLGSRWLHITLLKLKTPREHPWSILFHELVTNQVVIHRHTTHPWAPADAGVGILELLESEARHAGLIAGDAPELTAVDATHQMLMGVGDPS
jgi:hypothetical protein